MSQPQAAATHFFAPEAILEVRPQGSGNVNDTFLVTLDCPTQPHAILQRLNRRVFRQPELVMANLRLVTDHAARRRAASPAGRRWELPRALPSREGRDYWIDADGSFWRALSCIEGAVTRDTLTEPAQAGEIGWALGRFHATLSDLPPQRLGDVLPGFHVTPAYLRHFDRVLAGGRPPGAPEVAYALAFIQARRGGAGVLEEARARGELQLRPIHGDPKVNNVMLDAASGQAVGLVDLDTVTPGLVHYDLGDCLRSACNPAGEETPDWEAVRFELDLARALLTAYVAVGRDFLTPADYAYLYQAVPLIAFELGLRFFTDYLEGNVYFKARHPEHNLARALVQFRLAESIASQEATLRTIIREA